MHGRTAEIGMMDANLAAKIMYADADAADNQMKKQQNIRICSQAHYQQRKEDMWIQSSKQQIQENM